MDWYFNVHVVQKKSRCNTVSTAFVAGDAGLWQFLNICTASIRFSRAILSTVLVDCITVQATSVVDIKRQRYFCVKSVCSKCLPLPGTCSFTIGRNRHAALQ